MAEAIDDLAEERVTKQRSRSMIESQRSQDKTERNPHGATYHCTNIGVTTFTRPGVDTSNFEDPVIMSDAALWLARQRRDYTGHILTIADLRALGAVRGVTRVGDRA